MADSVDERLARGWELFYAGNAAWAKQVFVALAKDADDHVGAYDGWAMAAIVCEDFDGALEALNRRVLLEPSGRAYRYIGELYGKLGEPAQSLEAFEEALGLLPDWEAHDVLEQMLPLYRAHGNPVRGAAASLIAVRIGVLEADDPMPAEFMARACRRELRRGHADKALGMARWVSNVLPENPHLWRVVADMALGGGDLQLSQQALERANQLVPDREAGSRQTIAERLMELTVMEIFEELQGAS